MKAVKNPLPIGLVIVAIVLVIGNQHIVKVQLHFGGDVFISPPEHFVLRILPAVVVVIQGQGNFPAAELYYAECIGDFHDHGVLMAEPFTVNLVANFPDIDFIAEKSYVFINPGFELLHGILAHVIAVEDFAHNVADAVDSVNSCKILRSGLPFIEYNTGRHSLIMVSKGAYDVV
jgi:hypothetical protein